MAGAGLPSLVSPGGHPSSSCDGVCIDPPQPMARNHDEGKAKSGIPFCNTGSEIMTSIAVQVFQGAAAAAQTITFPVDKTNARLICRARPGLAANEICPHDARRSEQMGSRCTNSKGVAAGADVLHGRNVMISKQPAGRCGSFAFCLFEYGWANPGEAGHPFRIRRFRSGFDRSNAASRKCLLVFREAKEKLWTNLLHGLSGLGTSQMAGITGAAKTPLVRTRTRLP